MHMVMSIFKRGEKSMAKGLLTLEREAQAEAALKEKGGKNNKGDHKCKYKWKL